MQAVTPTTVYVRSAMFTAMSVNYRLTNLWYRPNSGIPHHISVLLCQRNIPANNYNFVLPPSLSFLSFSLSIFL